MAPPNYFRFVKSSTSFVSSSFYWVGKEQYQARYFVEVHTDNEGSDGTYRPEAAASKMIFSNNWDIVNGDGTDGNPRMNLNNDHDPEEVTSDWLAQNGGGGSTYGSGSMDWLGTPGNYYVSFWSTYYRDTDNPQPSGSFERTGDGTVGLDFTPAGWTATIKKQQASITIASNGAVTLNSLGDYSG